MSGERAAVGSDRSSLASGFRVGVAARPLLTWYALTCGGLWGLAALFAAAGGSWQSPAGRSVAILSTLPPLVAALLVQGAWLRRAVGGPLSVRPRIHPAVAVGWFVVPALVLALALLLAALAGYDVALDQPGYVANLRAIAEQAGQLDAFEARLTKGAPPAPGRLVVQGLLAGGFNGLLLYGHEIGWRGFSAAYLRGGWVMRGLKGGLLWGLALVPLAWQGRFHPMQPGWQAAGLTVLWAAALGVLLEGLRSWARSVFAPAMALGTLASLQPVAWQLVGGGSDLQRPLHGWTGVAAVVLLAVVVAAWLGRRGGFQGHGTEQLSRASDP